MAGQYFDISSIIDNNDRQLAYFYGALSLDKIKNSLSASVCIEAEK